MPAGVSAEFLEKLVEVGDFHDEDKEGKKEIAFAVGELLLLESEILNSSAISQIRQLRKEQHASAWFDF